MRLGESKAIDKNISMLSKKVLALTYQYNGVLPKIKIKERLNKYSKIKNDKKSGLNEAEYFMISGYVNALEWVLSGEIEESTQKTNMYEIEHSMR